MLNKYHASPAHISSNAATTPAQEEEKQPESYDTKQKIVGAATTVGKAAKKGGLPALGWAANKLQDLNEEYNNPNKPTEGEDTNARVGGQPDEKNQ